MRGPIYILCIKKIIVTTCALIYCNCGSCSFVTSGVTVCYGEDMVSVNLVMHKWFFNITTRCFLYIRYIYYTYIYTYILNIRLS